MLDLVRLQRFPLIYFALGLAAVIGWSTFACSTWSARELASQVSTLTTQRDEVIADRNEVRAKFEQLQRATGELQQVEAKLNVGNAELIPTRGLADSLGLPKSSRVRIDGGEWEIRHATGAYTSRGLRRRSPARGGSEDEERYPGASPFGTGRDL